MIEIPVYKDRVEKCKQIAHTHTTHTHAHTDNLCHHKTLYFMQKAGNYHFHTFVFVHTSHTLSLSLRSSISTMLLFSCFAQISALSLSLFLSAYPITHSLSLYFRFSSVTVSRWFMVHEYIYVCSDAYI